MRRRRARGGQASLAPEGLSWAWLGSAWLAGECKPGHVWESWSQGFPRAAHRGLLEVGEQMWMC